MKNFAPIILLSILALTLICSCSAGGDGSGGVQSGSVFSDSNTLDTAPETEEVREINTICRLQSEDFFVELSNFNGSMSRLICPSDETDLNYVMGDDRYSDRIRWFGDVDITCKKADGEMLTVSTHTSDACRRMRAVGKSSAVIDYSELSGSGLSLSESYSVNGEELTFCVQVTNNSANELTLLDVSFPLMFNSAIEGTQKQMYEDYVYNHSYIGYSSTYFYVSRNSGEGPVLLMYAKDGTSVEYQYWNGYYNCSSMYVHSAQAVIEHPNSAYLDATSKTLKPGESETYTFGLRWAEDYKSINDELYEAGATAFTSLPGMVTSTELPVSLDIRTKRSISAVYGQYADETEVVSLGTKEGGHNLYEISFSHTGQNILYIEYADSTRAALLYFITEPLDELISLNTDFISKNQQQTDYTDPCFMGFLPWDMVMADLTGDGLLDAGNFKTDGYFPTGWWHYGGDEMGFSPALYLSQKNVYDPDEKQIKQLVDYINYFIVRGMTEKFDDGSYRLHRGKPWEIMGTWDTDPRIDAKGRDSNTDCWRPYNYPHVINTYYNMYLIARTGIEVEGILTPKQYLTNAYELLNTFFTKWMYPKGESAQTKATGEGGLHFGNMGETVFFDIAEAFKNEGMEEEYAFLSEQLNKKAVYFSGEEYPYASESAFDTAAYESVYAYADSIGDTETVERVTKANIATRGQTPVWYLYGSDLPSQDKAVNLRYMTQLGGWALLDYTLNHSDDQSYDIRLAYGSYLAGWALINTGYYSSEEYNIGSSVWYYQGIKGETMDSVNSWEQILPVYNGAVAVSGESPLGFWAGLNMASTVIVNDEIFGLYAYGGAAESAGGKVTVLPKDGVNKRIHILTGDEKVSFELAGGGYDSSASSEDFSYMSFTLVNRSGNDGRYTLTLSGIPDGTYKVTSPDGETELKVVNGYAEYSGSYRSNIEIFVNKLS